MGGFLASLITGFRFWWARAKNFHDQHQKDCSRTNIIMIIASSPAGWSLVSFLLVKFQGSIESKSQSFSSTFIWNIVSLSIIWKPNQRTHLNALVPIGEGVHGGLLVGLKLGQHGVGLVQGHLNGFNDTSLTCSPFFCQPPLLILCPLSFSVSFCSRSLFSFCFALSLMKA